MTGNYDRCGIRFLYPENWELTDDALDEIPRTISVQAPSGAFWSVDIHPFSVDPTELLDEVVAAMRGEYADLEAFAATEQVNGQDADGFDMFFWCLDFVVTCRVRALRSGHATYLMTYQAEDREFQQMEPVFKAITHSFFQENQLFA